MHCEQFMEYAPEWMEGQRSTEALAHRSSCSRCGALIADLEAIQRAAPLLDQALAEPPERVWLAVRAELEAQGMWRPQRSWRDRLADLVPPVPRPALVGSFAALLAASALLFVTGGPHPLSDEISIAKMAPPAPANPFPAQLEKVAQKTMLSVHAHDPAIVASYRQNMAIVDNFITVCEKKVAEDPRNDVARDYLLSAYQQKADLLASIVDLGAQGD
jgi:hypothetical protein